MTAVNRATLYSYFNAGDKPTESQFDDLIDSNLNLATTSAQVITSDVSANGRMTVNAAIVVGSPTGGDKGAGTVNATGIYVNGTLLTAASGGSGTVNVGVSGQIAYYPMGSNSVSGTNTLPDNTIATTRALGTSNTQLATTGFANPASSLVAEGYQKFPSGMILQWGRDAFDAAGNSNITFPITFPNNIFGMTATVNKNPVSTGFVMSTQIVSISQAGATIYGSFGNNAGFGNLTSDETCFWMATGN